MVFRQVFRKFIEDSPVTVMFRGTLENVFAAERLDRIFAETAEKQYCHELLFSTCADIMGLVVTKIHKSVHAAYQAHVEEVGVSVRALYGKLAKIEPAVSERMVADTAARLAAIVRNMRADLPGPLSGYEVRIVDGNHLAGTDHRIKELRPLGAAALPGQTLCVLNPQLALIEAVITCEDGHANQRPLIPRILPLVQPRQVWLADRDFCIYVFLRGVRQRRGYFVVRQHEQLKGMLVGKPKRLGRIATGVVYEQGLRLTDEQGRPWRVRRITLKLDQPTRDGETEIHLLSNLPGKVSGQRIAQLYASRWNIETAFQDLAVAIRGEINTLGYPDAALFGFCVATMAYNAFSAVKAALRAAAGPAGLERKLSTYYLADEISGVYRGMAIAIDPEHWTHTFASLTVRQMARVLLELARKVNLRRFYVNPYRPKKKQPKRISGNRGNHVSTYQLLQQRLKAG